jgi:hypothetical protein
MSAFAPKRTLLDVLLAEADISSCSIRISCDFQIDNSHRVPGWAHNSAIGHKRSLMTRAEEYRHLAKKVRARAAREESPILRAEWENLAEGYVRLAEQPVASEQL